MSEMLDAATSQKLYSIRDAAQQLGGIGRTTVYELAKRGDVELVKIGARSFVTNESLNAYLRTLSTSK